MAPDILTTVETHSYDRAPALPGGVVGGARGVEITNAYVGAFLDRHLRGRAAPLLDGPAAEYPEVELRD